MTEPAPDTLFPLEPEPPRAPDPNLTEYTTTYGTTVTIPTGKELYFQRTYTTYIQGGYDPADAARNAARDVRAGLAKCLDLPPPRPVLSIGGKPVMALFRKK